MVWYFFQKAERLFGYSVSKPKFSPGSTIEPPLSSLQRQHQLDSQMCLKRTQEKTNLPPKFVEADWSQMKPFWLNTSTGAEEEKEEIDETEDGFSHHQSAICQLILDDDF